MAAGVDDLGSVGFGAVGGGEWGGPVGEFGQLTSGGLESLDWFVELGEVFGE